MSSHSHPSVLRLSLNSCLKTQASLASVLFGIPESRVSYLQFLHRMNLGAPAQSEFLPSCVGMLQKSEDPTAVTTDFQLTSTAPVHIPPPSTSASVLRSVAQQGPLEVACLTSCWLPLLHAHQQVASSLISQLPFPCVFSIFKYMLQFLLFTYASSAILFVPVGYAFCSCHFNGIWEGRKDKCVQFPCAKRPLIITSNCVFVNSSL